MTSSRAVSILLVPLGSVAAAAWSFAVFGAALWANIYVDGHHEAATLAVVSNVGPYALLFLAPGLLVIGVSRALRLPAGRNAFGAVALLLLPIFTFGYAIPALAGAAALWVAASWLARRRFTWPPVDLIPVLAGAVLISYWCYAEAHR